MKKVINPNILRTELKSGKLFPAYFAAGEEQWLLKEVENLFTSHLLDENIIDFNLDIFDSSAVAASELAAVLSSLPMMSPYRVVILKQAESSSRSIQNFLVKYVSKPVPETILLILYHGKPKAKWTTTIQNNSQGINCNRPRGRFLEDWIREQVKKAGCSIDDQTIQLLSEQKNYSLIDLANELEKASLLAGEAGMITPAILQSVWGIKTDLDIWRFFDQVASGDRLNAVTSFRDIREDYERSQSGFILSQVAGKLRLLLMSAGYDFKGIPYNQRNWPGKSEFQWKMASRKLKSLPPRVALHIMEEMLQQDRTRKTRQFSSSVLFERLIHRIWLERKEYGQ